VFLATQFLNASSLRSVSAGAEQEAEARLTMQRTQDRFEGAGPYGRSEPEEPCRICNPQLQKVADLFFVLKVLKFPSHDSERHHKASKELHRELGLVDPHLSATHVPLLDRASSARE
jgi:hypothetical protein